MAVNYNLNSATVLRDLYRLLSVVAADGAIAHEFESGDPLISLREKFMHDELLHLLVSTAVMNRLHGEHKRAERTNVADADNLCGRLILDFIKKPDDIIDLSLREACNKIIHADDITHEADDYAERSGLTVLPNTLVLRGRYNRRHWRAYLWLTAYIRASVKNFEGTA
jgi:hypothetical protein